MNQFANVIETPVGQFTTRVNERGQVLAVDFGATTDELNPEKTRHVDIQLHEYFRRERKEFELELSPKGSPFQERIWSLLVKIPYGTTRTYGDLAVEIDRHGAARAVGRANATNPIPIIVPCHRVIGGNGSLTGFAGGLEMKKWLLEFEREGKTLFGGI